MKSGGATKDKAIEKIDQIDNKRIGPTSKVKRWSERVTNDSHGLNSRLFHSSVDLAKLEEGEEARVNDLKGNGQRASMDTQ